MKRLIIRMIAVVAVLGSCNLYAAGNDSTSTAGKTDTKSIAVDKGDSTVRTDVGKGEKSQKVKVPKEEQGSSERERTVDFSLYVSILSLMAAAASLILLMQFKNRTSYEKKHQEYDIEGLGNEVTVLKSTYSSLKKQINELKAGMSDLNNEFVTIKSQQVAAPVAPEQHDAQPTMQEFSREIVYSVYQSGDNCFDSADFSKTPSGSLPFKLTIISSTEAEVEVMPGYDQSLNSQVKDVCDAVSGSWTGFHSLVTVQNGVLFKDSEESTCWKIKSKIQVRLS